MTRLAPWLIALAALPAAAAPSLCLWDYDTLQQERSRFPSTLELLTGRFPRHSEAYYRWRIEDREARRAAGEESAELYDDLGVAWSKLGEDARAIALMAEKEERYPGLYETAANLGTFHIHAGDYEQGAEHIARAIEINPEAHFGREVYQELLVRYVLERRGDAEGLELPLEPADVGQKFGEERPGFWSFVSRELEVAEENQVAEIGKAVQGVLGMMRFGNHDSPVLCEALSDLLLADWDTDAKNLASRALLRASYQVGDEATKQRYRAKAENCLELQLPNKKEHRTVELEEIEARFQRELTEAAEWWRTLEENERRWIEEGEDVDAKFAETYYGPNATSAPAKGEGGISKQTQIFAIAGLGLVGVAVLLALRGR